MKSSDVVAALDKRYSQHAGNRRNEQWVTITEARSGAGFAGNDRQCDYLAINTHPGQGLQIVGHEIKVSAADWKRELADPNKAETFAQYCRRWWVVMPSELAREVKHEVPPTWGLLSVSEAGNTRELVKAPSREPADVPAWWWIGWLAQLDRIAKRDIASQVQLRVRAQMAEARADISQEVDRRVAREKERLEGLVEKVSEFQEATGINIRYGQSQDWERLGALAAVVNHERRFAETARSLRAAADALDRFKETA